MIVHGFCSPPITMGGGGGGMEGVTQYENLPKFCVAVKKKRNGGVIFITILLHFHDFISLKTANTQKSEVFLLRISLGIVNACVTCRNLQIYNFSFRKEFLETL